MASSITSFNQFLSKTSHKTSHHPQLSPKVSIYSVNFANFGAKKAVQKSVLIKKLSQKRPSFVAQVAADDERGPEKESGVAVAEEEPPKEPTEIDILKKRLVDAFYGTNRGLTASSETRAEIVELINQLEAKNPTPAPTEALTLLNGKWILA